ncbi:glycosyltransferase family 2 protein [Nocardioides campestrisoli]|uniref:glycosyltransferase family 2 protein n=1 Tax=Nocardioides campestrisoli TaxID=2736757 RepID=UPI0015E652FF|nr:glycosyltransferase family A protein [Nocardioides campestrisoli]
MADAAAPAVDTASEVVAASAVAAAAEVDVVIATRGRPELLARALAAVRTQDHPGVVRTWVVFDQGPMDPSVTDQDPRRPVTALANTRTPGLAGARNSGIAAGRAPWVAFCDDDDRWLPNKLTAQLAELARTGAPTSVTGIVVAYGDTRTERVATSSELTLANLVRHRVMAAHPSTVVVAREALEGPIGLVDEEIPGSHGEDYDWIIRAARHAGFAVVEQPLVEVTWGQSLFSQRWATIVAATDYWLDKHPEFRADRHALARLSGQRAFALAAMRSPEVWPAIRQTLRCRPAERRTALALAVALRLVSAERLMDLAHRHGRGI